MSNGSTGVERFETLRVDFWRPFLTKGDTSLNISIESIGPRNPESKLDSPSSAPYRYEELVGSVKQALSVNFVLIKVFNKDPFDLESQEFLA